MTLLFARPVSGLAHRIILPLAIVLGLLVPPSAGAQDTNPGDCTANPDGENPACADKATGQESPAPVVRTMDWVPLEDVPEHQRDAQCINCGGRYEDPLARADKSVSPDESRIAYTRVDKSPVEVIKRSEIYADRIDLIEQRYPLTGTDNAIVKLGVIPVRNKNIPKCCH